VKSRTVKLFKIGTQLRVTVRKVWISFSESSTPQRFFVGLRLADQVSLTLLSPPFGRSRREEREQGE